MKEEEGEVKEKSANNFVTKNVSTCFSLTDYQSKYAEREGFEPPVVLPTSVFKTGALNRSAISPRRHKSRKKFFSHNRAN